MALIDILNADGKTDLGQKKCSLPFPSQAVLLSFAATEVLFKSRPHLTG